jgi:hypothetical protein
MEFMGLNFKEGVKLLLNGAGGQEFKKADKIEQARPPFKLPPRDKDMHRVFAYLVQTRCIDVDIVAHFAHKHTIYQSLPYGNVVFVGMDECGAPKFAHCKSTNSKSTLKLDVAGSDKKYAFRHIGESEYIHVFESPVDMLSFVTLHQNDWQHHSYIALGGLSLHSLFNALENNPQIRRVMLCLDNDEVGRAAYEKFEEVLTGCGYRVHSMFPTLKDWNEDTKRRSPSLELGATM